MGRALGGRVTVICAYVEIFVSCKRLLLAFVFCEFLRRGCALPLHPHNFKAGRCSVALHMIYFSFVDVVLVVMTVAIDQCRDWR